MNKYLAIMLLSTATIAGNVRAATVYDRDGTTFNVGGRVQSILFNGHSSGIADNDAGLVNSARLNLAARSRINDYVSAFAFSEWDMADGETTDPSRSHVKRSWGDSPSTREQHVGADFNEYGKVTLGKIYDSVYAVQFATDMFEDTGAIGNLTKNDRRPGTFRYDLNTNGVFFSLSGQTAQDKALVINRQYNVNGGFATSAGYTFSVNDNKSLSLKAGYSYLEGQNDRVYLSDGSFEDLKAFDSYKNAAASIAYGRFTEGLYLAALYNVMHFRYRKAGEDVSDSEDIKCIELVAGYTFDNGIGMFGGFETSDTRYVSSGHKSESLIKRRVPVFVFYQPLPSFRVWVKGEFDAGSNKAVKTRQKYDSGTIACLGARYTF